MLDWYLQIRSLHVASVIASGVLFLARGVGVQTRAGWPHAPPVRYLSYAVDTVLLSAGITLVVILPHAMFANGWLTVKLVLIVVYIVLGSLALKRARTARARLACLVAALGTYLFVVTIAWTHSPYGVLVFVLR